MHVAFDFTWGSNSELTAQKTELLSVRLVTYTHTCGGRFTVPNCLDACLRYSAAKTALPAAHSAPAAATMAVSHGDSGSDVLIPVTNMRVAITENVLRRSPSTDARITGF